jgi:RNA polymerase sigma factor (sigma-70 family)
MSSADPSAGPSSDANAVAEPVVDLRSAALERVLLRYGAMVRQSARARGLSEADVDEVLQDVRVRLWRSGSDTEKLDALNTSYIQRVAMSAAIDLLRRRRARREESLDAAHEPVETPVVLQVASPDRSDDEALAYRLEMGLAQLARNRRLCVQLHLEGYSRDEIAAMIGWSEPKVRNLLYRGLDELRGLLRESAEHAP